LPPKTGDPKNSSKNDFDLQFYPVLKNAVIAMKGITERKPEQWKSRKNKPSFYSSARNMTA